MELYQINVIHINRNFSCAINTDLILVVSCTTADGEINAGPKTAIVKQEGRGHLARLDQSFLIVGLGIIEATCLLDKLRCDPDP